jgi:hypothetical protein
MYCINQLRPPFVAHGKEHVSLRGRYSVFLWKPQPIMSDYPRRCFSKPSPQSWKGVCEMTREKRSPTDLIALPEFSQSLSPFPTWDKHSKGVCKNLEGHPMIASSLLT